MPDATPANTSPVEPKPTTLIRAFGEQANQPEIPICDPTRKKRGGNTFVLSLPLNGARNALPVAERNQQNQRLIQTSYGSKRDYQSFIGIWV